MVNDLDWLKSWLKGIEPAQMPISVDNAVMDPWLDQVKDDIRFQHLRVLRSKAVGIQREYPAGHLYSLYQILRSNHGA
jgi:hypothetical protein